MNRPSKSSFFFFEIFKNAGRWPFLISTKNQFSEPLFFSKGYHSKTDWEWNQRQLKFGILNFHKMKAAHWYLLLKRFSSLKVGLLWADKSKDFADIGVQLKIKESMIQGPCKYFTSGFIQFIRKRMSVLCFITNYF